MARLEYSQIVRGKLKALKTELAQAYGEDKSRVMIGRIVRGLKKLEILPQAGTAVSSQYHIECDYRYIFVEHNYFFYRMQDEDTVLVLEMFHEKQDFMRELFGIITTSQETADYWGE